MFQNAEMPDKPRQDGLWVHTIFTWERIAKWDGGQIDPANKTSYQTTRCEKIRTIRLYIAA